MPRTEPLCARCSQVSSEPAALRHLDAEDQPWTFGWIQNSKCPFCRLLKNAIAQDDRLETRPNRWRTGDAVTLVWEGFGPTGRGGFRLPRCRGLWIALGPSSNHSSRTFAEDLSDIGYLRPEIDAEIEIDRIKGSVAYCDENHRNCVLRLAKTASLDPFLGLCVLRLIDVKSRCLTEITANGPPYVVLSYVWGSVPTFKLTSYNRPELLRPGALDMDEISLPRTISDAMLLTRQLGFRYLCVDALCLIQNDAEDVRQGVDVMDRIYELASLTIVAACGHDANSGLPGVRAGTRVETPQLVWVQIDISFGVYFGPDHLIMKSFYHTRAWTFQEYLLSRRVLLFVDDKVFFRCQMSEQCESCFDNPKPSRGHTCSTVLPQLMEMSNPNDDFAKLLGYYTQCGMTNVQDALRALAGLMRRFRLKMGNAIFQGLPTSHFTDFLAFNGENLRRRSGMPSYSWAGWIGRVYVGVKSKRASNWIVWYGREPSGSVYLICDPAADISDSLSHSVDDGSSLDGRFSHSDDSSSDSRDRNSSPAGQPTSFHSMFASYTSSPTLKTAPSDTFSISDSKIPNYPLLQFWTLACYYQIQNIDMFLPKGSLVGREGQFCGTVWLDGFEEASVFHSVGATYEVILMSKSFHLWPNNDDDGDDIMGPGRRGDCFEIMLLGWQDGVAQRLGIGSLLRRAITQGFAPGPVWKEIVLG